MLTIIINWIYILLTTFCLGFALAVFSEKVLHYRFRRMDSVLMAGLIIATVYAQVFSLFYRVNIEANIVLVLLCIVIAAVWHKEMYHFLKTAFGESSVFRKIVILLLFFAWSFFTSRGYCVLDMNLYHGQSIHWIEEYGVVKGQGNLYGRFGYNSSIFAVSALYSMKFLLGRSLHAVNGLIAFILSVSLLDLGKCFQRRKMLLSDFARVAAAYYLTTIWDEIIAPSSDYAVMCTIFFIVIKWLTQLEEEKRENRENIAPYALLCVAGAFALTVKLSAGMILVLLCKPAYQLLKEKRWKEIGIYLCMGLLTAVPWMARTVLITGWLLYPFTPLDLFQVDWKMKNIGAINTDAAQIEVWAKAANAFGVDAPLKQWFPHWFSTELSATEKLLIVGDVVAGLLFLMITLKTFIQKKWEKLDILLVLAMLFCCYLFWQFKAPMFRYGYAYVLLLVAVMTGYLLKDSRIVKVLYVGLILFGTYKLYIGIDWIKGCYLLPNYVWQETYEVGGSHPWELEGYTFYATENGELPGYDPFPAAERENLEKIELRGEDIKDGFRLK